MSKVMAMYGQQIVCIGSISSCKNYINQLYEYKTDYIDFKPYVEDHYLYEDYNVVFIKEYQLYLTMGIVKLLQESCREEQSSVKFIQNELDKLIGLSMFSDELIEEMRNMKDTLDKVKKEHTMYLNNNLFENLDIDALHSAYNMERENKGLPTIYI